jgi:hypothetical protein
MNEVLKLTLSRKWFEMIASGEKKEEYRELKPYWHRRLSNHWCKAEKAKGNGGLKSFSMVRFRNGYQSDSPTMEVEIEFISNGVGKEEWGAPKEPVYIIKLGKILSIKNYKQ